ncbi:MAG: hypothetical protein HOI34_11350 [Rhodospirillaceae bacterium]|nr:hypothetical protein [Rhodospirillaceae bacterium]MBT6204284.1 hypothetical protein [Rhodospirillaceae bacterium]MBT6512765.1 hypothetical protein [Rhodospirillaceae bacterium]MBT7612950.1 hypothetical protein [Rhodospirillaceae bacterium]
MAQKINQAVLRHRGGEWGMRKTQTPAGKRQCDLRDVVIAKAENRLNIAIIAPMGKNRSRKRQHPGQEMFIRDCAMLGDHSDLSGRSFGMAGGMAFMNGLDLVTRAVSLGDSETLVQHPASMTHAAYSPEERAKHDISEGLVRMSVGLENIEDLLTDIEAGLDAAMTSRQAAQ